MKLNHFLVRTVLTAGLVVTLAPAQSQTDKSKANSTDHKTMSSGSSASGSGSMVGQSDQMFMNKAAMGGMAEVQMAQMAQQKASSQEVKDYARMLEQDHSKANDKLKSIASERQVTLPTDIGPEHQAMATKLNALSGEEFDRAYMKGMVADHKKDIKEFEKASNRSMDSNLKEFASSTLPTLREHLQKAEQLATSTRSRKADKSSMKSDDSKKSDTATK